MAQDKDVIDGLAVVAHVLTDSLSDDPKKSEALVLGRWPDAAAQLANALQDNKKLDWSVVFVAASLAELLCELIGADVAFVRVPNADIDDVYTLLPIVNWRIDPVGDVPKDKDINHGPCLPYETSGDNRGQHHNEDARNTGRYSGTEMRFLEWLKSEAWIPVCLGGTTRALIVFGKGETGFFEKDGEAIQRLRDYEEFVRAFYLLAEQTMDRARKSELLERIAAALPLLLEAESDKAFSRALLTLYTASTGFGFDRAFMFWLPNGEYPAECLFAVGEIGDENNAPKAGHRSLQAHLRGEYPLLATHLQKALTDENIHDADSLARLVRDNPLFFRETDMGWLKSFLDGSDRSEGVAKRLDESDPWINAVRDSRKGILVSPFDEYFILPFAPLGRQDGRPLGFMLVDLSYREVCHTPGIDFPDLRMACMVLHLIAAMWQARQDGETYLHMLDVLPVLKHEGPALGLNVAKFVNDVRGRYGADITELAGPVVETTKKLESAAEYVDRMKGERLRAPVIDLRESLGAFLEHACRRYPLLSCPTVDIESGLGVSMPIGTLNSVLDCIIHNAVKAAQGKPVGVTINSTRVRVPEGTGLFTERICLRISNDGPSIDENISPYLFVNRVSTRDSSVHNGAGLSSARQLVKAWGGDVFLRRCDPVEFEVVLEPCIPD